MRVKENMTYYECVKQVGLIKKDYVSFMHFFNEEEEDKWYYYQKMREIKKEIYSLKFEEWKKDKLWEYMNDDVTFLDLLSFL